MNIFSIILAACVMANASAARPNYLHERSLFWVEESKGIFHLNEAGERVCVVDTDAVIGDIAVDVNIPKLFWSEPENGSIKAFSFQTGEIEDVLNGINTPRVVALDGQRNWLFYGVRQENGEYTVIKQFDLDNREPAVELGIGFDLREIFVDSDHAVLLIDDGLNRAGFLSYDGWRRQPVHWLTWGEYDSGPALDRKNRCCFTWSLSDSNPGYFRLSLTDGSGTHLISTPSNDENANTFPYTYSDAMRRLVLALPDALLAYDQANVRDPTTLICFERESVGRLVHLTAPTDSNNPFIPSAKKYTFTFLIALVTVLLVIGYCSRRFLRKRNLSFHLGRYPTLACMVFTALIFLWIATTTAVFGRRLVAAVGNQNTAAMLIVGTFEITQSNNPNLWLGGFHMSPASLGPDTVIHSSTWWPQYYTNTTTKAWHVLRIPLWLIALPFTYSPIKFFIVLRRRRKRRQCWACGYDVSTGGQATCPECGWQVVVEEVQEDDTNKEDDQNGWTLGG